MAVVPKKNARKALKKVLSQFGIVSANHGLFQELMEDVVETSLKNFGKPSEMIMHEYDFRSMIEAITKDEK